MRTRAILGSILASIAVLVVGYQAGAASLAATTTTTSQPLASGTSTTGTSATGTTTSGSSSTTTPTTTTDTPAASGATDGTYTGTSVDTRFGSVQVQVTIAGGAITAVTAVHLTDQDGRSVQISNRAAPILSSEVIASQSANVSSVSGATYTTQAYLSSVQSALDQAGF